MKMYFQLYNNYFLLFIEKQKDSISPQSAVFATLPSLLLPLFQTFGNKNSRSFILLNQTESLKFPIDMQTKI